MKIFSHALAVLLLLSTYACNDSESPLLSDDSFESFEISYSDKKYVINHQDDLHTYIKSIVDEPILGIIRAEFTHLPSENGTFPAIRAVYSLADEMVTMVLPLEIKHSPGVIARADGAPSYTVGCRMECKAAPDCAAGCDQTIYEACKRQSCSCKTPTEFNSGCDAVTIFF